MNKNTKKFIEEHAIERVKWFLRQNCDIIIDDFSYNDKTETHDGTFTYNNTRYFVQVKGSQIETKTKQSMKKVYVADGVRNLHIFIYVTDIDLANQGSGIIHYKIMNKQFIHNFLSNKKNSMSFNKVEFHILNNETVSLFKNKLLEVYNEKDRDEIDLVMIADKEISNITATPIFSEKIKEKDRWIVPITLKSVIVDKDFNFNIKDKTYQYASAEFPVSKIYNLEFIEMTAADSIIYNYEQLLIIKQYKENGEFEMTVKFTFNPTLLTHYFEIKKFLIEYFICILEDSNQLNEIIWKLNHFVVKLKVFKENVIDLFLVADMSDKKLVDTDYINLVKLKGKVDYDEKKEMFYTQKISATDLEVLYCQNKKLGGVIVNKNVKMGIASDNSSLKLDVSLAFFIPIDGKLPSRIKNFGNWFNCVNMDYKYVLMKLKEQPLLLGDNQDGVRILMFNLLFWLYENDFTDVTYAKDILTFFKREYKEWYCNNETVQTSMNLLQFEYLSRNNDVSFEAKQWLISLLKEKATTTEAYEINFCIFCLLNEYKRAKETYEKFSLEEQDMISQFPIFYLYQKLEFNFPGF